MVRNWEDVYVIGSTVVPEPCILPQRLSEIYIVECDDENYFIPYGKEGEKWSREPRILIDEEFEYGSMVKFQHPIPAQPNHALLQVCISSPPEYLTIAELMHRVDEIEKDKGKNHGTES